MFCNNKIFGVVCLSMSGDSVKKLKQCECSMSRLALDDTATDVEERKKGEMNGKTKTPDIPNGNKYLVDVCTNFVKDMNAFGIFVIDNFLGEEKGSVVLQEVLNLHKSGVFKEGQLVRNNEKNNNIRGDHITWVVGNESNCRNIGQLIFEMDKIVLTANKRPNNGVLGDYRIDGRTKAMVACYPAKGTQYVKHVDNPNKDGRCITAIYYLNKDWNTKEDGGMLRIYPVGAKSQVAQIEPKFDRMLFFWSDRRNPHEVLPSFKTRYAITIWYFDAVERNEHLRRRPQDEKTQSHKSTQQLER